MSSRLPIFLCLCVFGSAMSGLRATAATTDKADVCMAPAYHRLDFWLGDWDTFDTGKPDAQSQARNHVTSILDGCVLLEDYVQADGLTGQSFTLYDASRKLWHQTWVTNQGGLLVIEGRFQGQRLSMHGIEYDHDGHPVAVRAAWWPVPGGVRETAARSTDAGKTWQPWFDITFRPHHGR